MDKPSWTNRKIGDWFAASDYHLAIQMRDEFGAYITELESQLAARTNIDAADIPLCDDESLPHYDPVWVRTLWQAYKAMEAENVELKNGVAEMENELEQDFQAEQWQPAKDGKLIDSVDNEIELHISNNGADMHVIWPEDSILVNLPKDHAICKVVQPLGNEYKPQAQTADDDDAWICKGCGKVPGPDEGSDDLPDLCDDCWAKARGVQQ